MVCGRRRVDNAGRGREPDVRKLNLENAFFIGCTNVYNVRHCYIDTT